MAETIVSAECDGSDGIFKKSTEKDEGLESKVDCNMPDEAQEEKEELLEEFSILPSHSTSKETQSHMILSVTANLKYPSSAINSPITVGDQVTISDCYGHNAFGLG